MFTFTLSSPLWQLVAQADGVTKGVLFVLLVMSVLCWSLFLYKYMLLRTKKRQMKQAFTALRHVHSMEDLAAITDSCAGTTAGYFLTTNMHFLKSLIEVKNRQGTGKLGVPQWERVQDSLYNTIDEVIYHEEQGIWVLSTCAAAATLLGLFGTVWGLVHAFVSISEKQTADIATVAPGIAEALLTTLAGLLVAIPALVMFNYLSTHIRRIEQQLHNLAQHFNRIIQMMFVC